MKKLFFYAATAALVVSCASDETFIPETDNQGAAIEFGTKTANASRANFTGDAAATLLGGEFVVYGQKTVNSVASTTFDGVVVSYDDSDGDPANHVWNYVTVTEPVRYWDTKAASYDFYAYSDANATSIVTPEADIYADGITLAKSAVEDLSKVYVAPVVNVTPTFSSPVTFAFKSTVAKVRVAFWSAIEGYDVKIDKFYVTADTKSNATVLKGTFFSEAAYSVAADGTQATTDADDDVVDLTLGSNITAATAISTTKASATFDTDGALYTSVLPTMAAAKDVKVKIDYTLTSTVSGETLTDTKEVTLDKEYFQWQPNYAYTYYFKLTNGMEPIKFAAEVVPFEEVEVVDGDLADGDDFAVEI